MTAQEPKYNFDRVARIAVSAVTIVAIFATLRYLSDVLLPFAAAVVLAYLLNPVVAAFERRTKRRGLAVGITIGGLAIVGTTIVAVLIPLTLTQVGRFQADVESLRKDFAASVPHGSAVEPLESMDDGASGEDAIGKSATGLRELMDGWSIYRSQLDTPRAERIAALHEKISGTYVGQAVDRAVLYTESAEFNKLLVDVAKRAAIGGWTVLTFAVNLLLALTGLIVVMLYLVFLLLDYPEYARTWQTFLPPQYRTPIVEFLEQFDVALRRYFRGQSLVALLVGTLFAIGFTLIGLPMAVPFGLFVGLLNMVPYLQTVGVIPGLLLAGLRAIEGDSSFLVSVMLVLAIFGVVQLIQDALITPRIMGRATGLRPVAILLGIFIWGKVLGFLGLLLAIPLTCLGIAYYQRFILKNDADSGPAPMQE